MPELPECEITARRIGEAIAGARVESTLAPGINALKTFDPPLHALDGGTVTGLRRRGKLLALDVDTAAQERLTLLLHLMSAGRLQLYDKRASLRDRVNRILIRLEGGRELRMREFGTRQAAWAKLYRAAELESDDQLATLGPEAWPSPPADLGERLAAAGARPLHSVLRDQQVIAGIGRTWVDEILHHAQLSPFKRGDDLDEPELAGLAEAIRAELDRVVAHYEETVTLPIPDKLPKPVRVHGRQGEPCYRCGAVLEAVFYEDYVMTYCPTDQTDGRVLKDRRLSRLLK